MGLLDMFKGKARPANNELVVMAPVGGKALRMADIPDPVFSGGMMGQAVAIWPETGMAVSPVAGKVVAAMPHAFGLVTPNGEEIIVHIGVDTVEMAGAGFDVKVKVGQDLQVGDPLVTFDRDAIADAGFKDVVIVAVSNSEDVVASGGLVGDVAADEVGVGDPLLRVVRGSGA